MMGNKLLGLTFRGFTKEIDAADVAERFRHKYGYEPELVVDGKSVWLAGPIGGNGQGGKLPPLSGAGAEFPHLDGAEPEMSPMADIQQTSPMGEAEQLSFLEVHHV